MNREIAAKDWNGRAPGSIFNSETINQTGPGLYDPILESLMKIDHDFRGELMGNIILSGG